MKAGEAQLPKSKSGWRWPCRSQTAMQNTEYTCNHSIETSTVQVEEGHGKVGLRVGLKIRNKAYRMHRCRFSRHARPHAFKKCLYLSFCDFVLDSCIAIQTFWIFDSIPGVRAHVEGCLTMRAFRAFPFVTSKALAAPHHTVETIVRVEQRESYFISA